MFLDNIVLTKYMEVQFTSNDIHVKDVIGAESLEVLSGKSALKVTFALNYLFHIWNATDPSQAI